MNFINNVKIIDMRVAVFCLMMGKSGKSKEEIFQWFKDEFYKDYIVEIYPIDAMKLNTSIMIDLIQKEVM